MIVARTAAASVADAATASGACFIGYRTLWKAFVSHSVIAFVTSRADIAIRQCGVLGDIAGHGWRQEMIDAPHRYDRHGSRTASLLRQLAEPVEVRHRHLGVELAMDEEHRLSDIL